MGWPRGPSGPASKEFDAEYFKRFKNAPCLPLPIQAYAALRVAAEAINNAKSVEAGRRFATLSRTST